MPIRSETSAWMTSQSRSRGFLLRRSRVITAFGARSAEDADSEGSDEDGSEGGCEAVIDWKPDEATDELSTETTEAEVGNDGEPS